MLSDTLRDRIDRGVYPPDGRLPSEAELVAEFGVSRTTVRAALTALQNEGLLRAQPGVGYFVRDMTHVIYRPQEEFGVKELPGADQLTGTTRASKVARADEMTYRFEVSIVAAPPDVARRLRVREGEFVVQRKRVRLLGDDPYQLLDGYYPRDVAEDTVVMQPHDIERGVIRVLAEHGFPQVRALDEIWVRMPRRDEVDRLRILPGTPVAEHITTGFTAEGRPVRMVRAVLPGDRNVITFDRVHPDHQELEH
jgi:GntR family transcriptional regulator